MRFPTADIIPVFAFTPQAVGTAAVKGATIVAPWIHGRKLTFLWSSAAMGASDAYTITYEARRKGTSTWDTIKEYDGVANLGPVSTALVDGGAIEGGTIMSTIDLERLSSRASGANLGTTYEYDAIRASAVNANNSSPPIVSASAFVWDLYESPAIDFAGNPVVDYTYQKTSGVGL